MNKNTHKYWAFAALATVVPSSYASVDVNGSLISWPDDGWYQVQNADDFTSICEGTRSCEVEPGEYIVINHTTGERHEGVVVTTSGGASNGPSVDGNVISWPDDDWYQVQDSTTYESLCEGGLSCTVTPGSYTVINLSTGTRFENITVSGSIVVEPPAVETQAPSVSGNIISWADNGWYQVQRAGSYESMCQGGRQCEVPAGTYIVINLTTGERFENIMVEGDTTPEDVFPLDEVAPSLLTSLAIYQSDQLAPLIDTLAFDAIDGATHEGESLADTEFTTEDSRFDTVSTPIQRVSYHCANGGTLVRETGRMRLRDIDYSHDRDVDGYEFNDCRFNSQSGPLPSGDYVATGYLVIDSRFRSGPRFSENESHFTWEQFDLQSPDGSGYALSGSSSHDGISGAYTNSVVNRDSSFDYYQKRQGDSTIISVKNSTFRQRLIGHQVGLSSSVEIELAGSISGTLTNENEVLIQTDTVLSHTAALESFPDLYVPFTGQLSLSSSDGSYMAMAAVPSETDFSPYQPTLAMDWSGYTADGTVISRSGVLLDQFSVSAPNCGYARLDSDDEAAFACTEDGEEFVIP